MSLLWRVTREIGREVSEQLEFIPARLKAIRHERVRFTPAGAAKSMWCWLPSHRNRSTKACRDRDCWRT
ncbi:IS66 family transposase zinc-finger binding domain-containing protein [Schlesneria sp. DSM 10557]|uniref:IS66 family transposase zinc-finger binding domain-containing protein n=1 Tax=Schlesneria sp. DSM 10557 TaxID=3044399 RepID=UPI0035A1715C